MNPTPWMSDVQNEYLTANQSIPWFLDTNNEDKKIGHRFSDKRARYNGKNNLESVLFANKVKMNLDKEIVIHAVSY